MSTQSVAILHYSAPPVVGGVESVIAAHIRLLIRHDYAVTVLSGRGDKSALMPGCEFIHMPELDTQHPRVVSLNEGLNRGDLRPDFAALRDQISTALGPALQPFDHVIVHNVFTKHFNLPFTAALHQLLDHKLIHHGVAWCHDISWASTNSLPMLHPGYPWDLLRGCRDDLAYVAVSRFQQTMLAETTGQSAENIRVVHNGVDPQSVLGLSDEGLEWISRLRLLESDLTLFMPVRVTRAKNIELAIRVAYALHGRGVAPRVIITGPADPHDAAASDYFRELKVLRRRLGVEDTVTFVVEDNPDPGNSFGLTASVVGDLYRVSDLLFMPSLREGFGLPVLEAGLAGLPVMCSAFPAAQEIGGADVTLILPDDDPDTIAGKILDWAESSSTVRLRRRVRQEFTWDAIFHRSIRPLLS